MAVSIHKTRSVCLALFVLLQFLSVQPAKLAERNQGFTIDLVHRDSPSSPLYNSSASRYDSIHASVRRSISRANHFKSIFSSLASSPRAEAPVVPTGGSYLMNISIGSPPRPFIGIADTGSDLIWTQCKPCTECYKQKLPIFDPRSSKTYEPSSCVTKACMNVLGRNYAGCSSEKTCLYQYAYGDQSHTTGELAFETLTFGDSTSFDGILFGCGHDNGGLFDAEGSGLIGLGGGPASLVRQLKLAGGSKFSYCLIPDDGDDQKTTPSHSSKIKFGSSAEVSGSGVACTPLVKKYPATFYYLTLESISVNGGKGSMSSKKITAPASLGDDGDEGNIIIDSGTTLTFLPADMYHHLVQALHEAIQGERVRDPTGLLELCYRNDRSLRIPSVTVRFAGGADVRLGPKNMFMAMQEDVVCLAMTSSEEDVAIFGNVSQMDFLVGYDLDEKTVSFKPYDCKKYV